MEQKKRPLTRDQVIWQQARDRLVAAIRELGFPEELGELAARNLGSPKAIDRMTAYLGLAKPRSAEMVVDEMLAIMSEIEAWKRKKASEEANRKYNEYLYNRTDED